MPDHLPGPSRRNLGAIRRRLPARATLVGAAAMGAAITIVGTVTAFGGVHLSAVDAQPKATGMAAPERAEPPAQRVERGAGLHPAGEPGADGVVAYYGYLADGTLDAPGRPSSRRPQRGGAEDRARQEHLPRAARPARRGRRVRLRHALPVPGPRGRPARATSPGSTSTPTPPTGSRSSRRRRSPRTCRPATCPTYRRVGLEPVHADAAVHRRGQRRHDGRRLGGHAGLPVDGRRPLGLFGRGGYEGIQEDSAATSGSSRTSAARAAAGAGQPTNAKQPNSFVYRFVP